MEHLPVALRQLAEGPGFVLMFAALVAAFLLLLQFLRMRPRGSRYSQLSLYQDFAITTLLAIMCGVVWGLSYSSMELQGSISSYLAGASSMFLWLSAATSMVLGTALALQTVARLVSDWIKH